MTEEEIDTLVTTLSPEAKLLVTLLREQISQLHAQLEKLQKMLFGRRSKKNTAHRKGFARRKNTSENHQRRSDADGR